MWSAVNITSMSGLEGQWPCFHERYGRRLHASMSGMEGGVIASMHVIWKTVALLPRAMLPVCGCCPVLLSYALDSRFPWLID